MPNGGLFSDVEKGEYVGAAEVIKRIFMEDLGKPEDGS
jgi:hypothetical protein